MVAIITFEEVRISHENFEVLAKAVHAQNITHSFSLMGDGNIDFSGALAHQGVGFIRRHEHCAVSMAMAHARVTGGVVLLRYVGPGLADYD